MKFARLSLSLSRCHAACEEWEEVLALLGPQDDQLPGESPPPVPAADVNVPSLSDISSAMQVLKATAHEGLGDLPSAIECYKQVSSVLS